MDKVYEIFKILYKKFGPQRWWPVKSKKDDQAKFEIIIGAILTQNTAWKNVEKAIDNLHQHNLININRIAKLSTKKLASLIKSAGYYNQKAVRLKEIAKHLTNYKNISEFLNKDINKLRKELLNIKGIGLETADSIILYAANKPIFVIDAYTKRIFSRLGMCNKQTSYEELQKFFMENLPLDYKIFNEYHALLVELGKHYCKKKPNCVGCPLRNICKYKKNLNNSNKKLL